MQHLIYGKIICDNEPMDGLMDWWMDGWMDGYIDWHTGGRMPQYPSATSDQG